MWRRMTWGFILEQVSCCTGKRWALAFASHREAAFTADPASKK